MVERRQQKGVRAPRPQNGAQREVVNPLLDDELDDFEDEYVSISSHSEYDPVEQSDTMSLPPVESSPMGEEHHAQGEDDHVSTYHEDMYAFYDEAETVGSESGDTDGFLEDGAYASSDERSYVPGEENYLESPENAMDDTEDVALPMVDFSLPDTSHDVYTSSEEFNAIYDLPERTAEDYEEEVAFESPWDDTDDIVASLQQAVEERSSELENAGGESTGDDRNDVLQALLASQGDDTHDSAADGDESADGLLESIHENSPFAAVDDDDNIPDWFSLDRVLSDAIDDDVSDVYITPDNYVHFKKYDLIYEQKEYGFILPEITEKLYMAIITNVEESEFVEERELDASYVMRSGRHTGRRFRMSLGNTFGAQYLNFRIIASEVPTPEDLRVPEILQNWAKLSRGIFMVNGPTGSGKSTTIASLVRQIQLQERKTIITIERPIEFEYPKDGKSLVIQRNVGSDTHSFSNGLKTSLRNAPDIIVVGEVRDREEVDELLRAAETGHLAISTMHTETCAGTISRMTGLYSGEDRNRVTDVLSTVGRGFANQLLLRKPDGSGRTAIHEILEVDEDVAALIAANDIAGIIAYQNERKASMDHELAKAYIRKQCTLEDARSLASNPAALDRILRTEDF